MPALKKLIKSKQSAESSIERLEKKRVPERRSGHSNAERESFDSERKRAIEREEVRL